MSKGIKKARYENIHFKLVLESCQTAKYYFLNNFPQNWPKMIHASQTWSVLGTKQGPTSTGSSIVLPGPFDGSRVRDLAWAN